MIESLFPRDWPRYVDGPCGTLVRDFACWIAPRGYTRSCATGHIRRFRSAFMRTGVKIGAGRSISSAALARRFAPWAHDPWYRGTHAAAKLYFAERELLIVTLKPKPFHSLLAAYESFLVDQRGLSVSTVKRHCQTVHVFLKSTCPRTRSLYRLSRNDIERFVDDVSRGCSRQSLQHTVAHLRSFLRYCFGHRLTGHRLDIIDAPRAFRHELPPRALPWNMVRRLISSIDKSNIEGCRDHAIIYLMAYYGMRPSEVAALTVDSVDWDNRTLRVDQFKTRSVAILPLDDRTVHVVGRYLRCRPDGPWKELFLRVRCPAGPIKAATIGDIYTNRVQRSGLPIQDSSAYSLRHSFAMRLLERGVGVTLIGDLLGHRVIESTCVYLRLHTNALRDVALPVPYRSRFAVEAGT